MPTCPNCGEIVMNGDPYCPNCGTVFNRPSYDENRIDEFNNHYFYAFDGYNIGNYEFAFLNLDLTFQNYKHMSNSEKSRVKERLEREWVGDLCCIIANNHGKYYDRAINIIEEMGFEFNECMDCDCIYLIRDKFCNRCGKPLGDF